MPVIEPLRREPARTARRQQRVGRRRKRGQVVLALVLLAALLAGAAAYFVLRPGGVDGTTKSAADTRSQRTLLLQIASPGEGATVAVLLATDSKTDAASLVLVPALMLSQVPGHGTAAFGEAHALGGPQLSQDTLANQLGLIIDRTWTLTPGELAQLVDSVGGIDVAVDIDLPGGTESSGIALRSGQQVLNGPAAAAFATYAADNAPELARLMRLQVVLLGLLEKLPKTTGEISALLPAGQSAAGPAPHTVADALRALDEARLDKKLTYKVVPVADVDVGIDEETTRLDTDKLAAMIAPDLTASVPDNAFRPNNRVVVRNGVGTAGIGQSVTRRLNAAGFAVVQTGNADTFDYKTTEVLIFAEADEAVGAGDAAAAALGLTGDAVKISDTEQSVADVIINVGADYAELPAAASVGP
ncbi:MAG: LCP family protein [Mycobacteriales bacterium]